MENRETVYITREETFASLCIKNHVAVFSNETYDKLSFEMDHISIASLPGMYQRTVTIYELSREDFLLNRMENRLGDCTTSSNVGDSTSADLPHVQDVDAHAIRSRCSSRGARVLLQGAEKRL